MSLCPYCSNEFQQVKLTGIKAVHPNKTWDAVSLDCPQCDRSLSVALDPVKMKTLAVEEITAHLRTLSVRQSSY